MSARHFAQVLYRVRTHVQTGARLDDADREFFVDAVDRFFDGARIEEALGLKLEPGEKHPSFEIKISLRNDALRAAAALLSERDVPAAARALSEKLDRYRTNGWLRDREAEACPARLAGRIEAHFWEALRQRDLAIGAKQIEKVLEKPMELKSAY